MSSSPQRPFEGHDTICRKSWEFRLDGPLRIPRSEAFQPLYPTRAKLVSSNGVGSTVMLSARPHSCPNPNPMFFYLRDSRP